MFGSKTATIQRSQWTTAARWVALIGLVFLQSERIALAQWTTSGTNIYSSNSGNVGIGQSSPASKLDVNGWISANGGVGSGGTQGGFLASDRITGGYAVFYRQSGVNRLWDNTAGDVIAFDSLGRVGIGTIAPSSALEVVGDVTVSGNISAKYQDIAEWVPSLREIAPGTVVIQDPDGINSVIPSTESYDTRVAGVVSANPGIVLGEAGDGKVRVATTGRVKVHVDASHGAIRAGDLLVTSGKEGTAMRSEPIDVSGIKLHRPGTLIGKALEPLAEGEGEILVLLSLQ